MMDENSGCLQIRATLVLGSAIFGFLSTYLVGNVAVISETSQMKVDFPVIQCQISL